MEKNKVLVIEQSEIMRDGIGAILRSHSYRYEIINAVDVSEIRNYLTLLDDFIILINPAIFFHSQDDTLRKIKKETSGCNFKLVALIYSYYDEQVLSMFDECIYINETSESIISKIDNLFNHKQKTVNGENAPTLSQRELDVVKLVALGLSNKEIADELNISIHTVISHRKNITTKLGVKSASGLTFYAVLNKLIDYSDFEKTV